MTAALRLTNTLSKTVEEFAPLTPGGVVRLYSCGPTVYSFAHIGNFRSFLVADVLRRVLERSGYQVRQVMNVTDVGHMTQDHLADAHGEDKLAKAARELGWDPYRVAEHFLAAFMVDARALRLRSYSDAEGNAAELHPRATRFVPEMLQLIQQLVERGHAYVDSQGQVYYSIVSFPEYGQLSGKVLDELEVGARVEVREEKRDPRDFALWKVDPKHLMQWDPHSGEGWVAPDDYARLQRLLPAGVDPRIKRGFPGWHIECSAMSTATLGPIIDVHTGGEDNVFPHHECEIAQSCGAADITVPGPPGDSSRRRSFARYWVHGRHLLVDGRKMSKRDGNFYTVRDLLDPVASGRPELKDKLIAAGFPEGAIAAPVLRLSLIWGHYRQLMNFSFDSLTQAKSAVQRVQSLYDRAFELGSTASASAAAPAVTAALDAGVQAFDQALREDLDMERAMAALLDMVAKVNVLELGPAEGRAVMTALEGLDEVLALLVRRRIGVVDKEQLLRWLDPGFIIARGAEYAALPAWQGDPARQPLLAELSAGRLPAVAALQALPGEPDDALIELFIAARQAAKKAKDFAGADGARAHLRARGIIIEDLPAGIRWKAAG
jgi:cysteinyl-tRNA synthetase